MSADVAIVHKHYPERGGAERVADELARTFDAPVYTGVAEADATSDDVEVRELFGDSVLAPIMRRTSMPWQAIRDAYYVVNWDHCPDLAEFDVLVQSGMAPFWYVPHPSQTVVRYVHSPPRLPYDRYQEAGESRFVRAYARAARALLGQTVSYADAYVANSEVVARRLDQAFGVGREGVEVVYPPIDVDGLTPHPSGGDYYLALSRLDPAKCFDEAIAAFREHPEKDLVIAGDGADRDRLERLAADMDNVRFAGYVSEARKAELLQDARALVYTARQEDFGMVPVEAFAAGTPVIGVAEGFTAHQIEDGWSGVTFDRGVDELAAAIERFEREGVAASPEELATVARQCRPERFRERMQEIVADAEAGATVETPSWGSLAQRGEGPQLRVPARPDGGERDG